MLEWLKKLIGPKYKEGDVFRYTFDDDKEEWEKTPPTLYKILKVGKKKYLFMCINDRLSGGLYFQQTSEFSIIDPNTVKVENSDES